MDGSQALDYAVIVNDQIQSIAPTHDLARTIAKIWSLSAFMEAKIMDLRTNQVEESWFQGALLKHV